MNFDAVQARLRRFNPLSHLGGSKVSQLDKVSRIRLRQPRRLTLMWFQRNPLPVDWQAQRDIITNFE